MQDLPEVIFSHNFCKRDLHLIPLGKKRSKSCNQNGPQGHCNFPIRKVGHVRRQGRKSVIIGSYRSLQPSYRPLQSRNKLCSGSVHSLEHRIQGGVKFSRVKGSSSHYKLNVVNFIDNFILSNISNR